MQMADMDARTTREAAGTDAGEPAYLQLEGVTKRYAGHQARSMRCIWPAARQVAGPAGPVRLWQDHDPAHDRGPAVRDVRSYPGGRRRYFASRRTSATSAWCSRTTRCSRMSVAQNVAFGLEMRGMGKSDIQARVDEALEMVRLPDTARADPGNVRRAAAAGGAGPRAGHPAAHPAAGRALSNLTPSCATRCGSRSATSSSGSASPRFVTHDQVEALTMCDVVGVMAGGRLAQLGTPRISTSGPPRCSSPISSAAPTCWTG